METEDFNTAMNQQHEAWNEEQEFYASESAKAQADIQAKEGDAIFQAGRLSMAREIIDYLEKIGATTLYQEHKFGGSQYYRDLKYCSFWQAKVKEWLGEQK